MDLNAVELEKFRARTRRSQELFDLTKEVIPMGHGGGMGYFVPGGSLLVERAKGCWLWDVDGNRYLDLRIGDWVCIHGHCDEDIERAVIEQLQRSVQIGGPEWDLGYRTATLLRDRTRGRRAWPAPRARWPARSTAARPRIETRGSVP